MPTGSIIVALDVRYKGSRQGLDEEEAMLQIFGLTDSVRLRASSSSYVSGNYDRIWIEGEAGGLSKMWIGELTGARNVGAVHFAYLPHAHALLVEERAGFPYTRVRSYARRAARLGGRGIELDLAPRSTPADVRSQLMLFDEVYSVYTKLRHSCSPGSQFVDWFLEDLNAELSAETISAAKGHALNIKNLLENHALPQAQKVLHLALNPKNGAARIRGRIGGLVVELNTTRPVARYRVETDRRSSASFAEAISSLATRIFR